MNAVGIDVSKEKSMVATLRPLGELALTPREYPHNAIGLNLLVLTIIDLDEDTRVIMEATQALVARYAPRRGSRNAPASLS